MMRWAYGIGIALGALAGACLLPELKSLGGGGELSDAAATDVVSNDVSAPDGAQGDAALDAGRTPCPDSSFCDDFDEEPLGARWTMKEVLYGLLALEDGGVSAPNRMRMDLLAPTGPTRRAGMQKLIPIPSQMSRVVCTVSIRVDLRPPLSGDDYQVVEITQRDGSRTTTYVKVASGGTQLLEARPNGDGGTATTTKTVTTAGGGIPTGVWTKLTLDANYGAKTTTLTIVPEGGAATQLTSSLFAGANNKTLELYLGEPDDSDNGLSTTQFDDFRCDFTQ